MRPASATFADVIKHSVERELVADVYYGATRVLQNVPVSDWSFKGDYDAEIKNSANITIVYDGDFGESLSPHKLGDPLAAYGQTARLYCKVRQGTFTETISMGIYRIESVPSAKDSQQKYQKRVITKGSTVELDLLDLFLTTKRAQFRTLQQTPSLTSAWAEIARLTGMQVTRNVTDVAIPNSVIYGRSRTDAVQQIAKLLGGRAYVTADGSVSLIPDAVGSPVANLTIGPEGTIIDADYSQHSEGIANVVILDTQDDAGNAIHSEAAITSGPLSVNGPYGEYVIEYPADQLAFIKTQSAADTATAAYLAVVSNTSIYELPITCVFDPRLEAGDIVTVQRMDRLLTGRILTISSAKKGPMSLNLAVTNDQPL